MTKKPLPQLKTEAEEADFWASHDSTEYLDWDRGEWVVQAPLVRSSRCPVCGQVLLSRYVDVDVAGGRVTLHKMRELYCPQEHVVRLAPESEELIKRLSAFLEIELPERAAA